MNSADLKISEAVLYIRFNGSTVERRPSFSIEFIKLLGRQGLYSLKKYYV